MRERLIAFIRGDRHAAGIVPATGAAALLVGLSAAATAFLAVAAICLGLAAARLADRWQEELAQAATLRISGPAEEMEARVAAALAALRATPGIALARAMSLEESARLLEPWLGAGVPLEALPVPRLIEIRETAAGPDRDSLAKRLEGEVPGAIYDDHSRWRRPLVRAASGLELLAAVAVFLTLFLMMAMVTLAARASLAAHQNVVATLRLVGAADGFITRAFVRRFTLRALGGAAAGTLAGAIGVLMVPVPDIEGDLATALAPQGLGWLALVTIPVVAAAAAYWATRGATRAALRHLP
ncbi:MAG TPA: cell division protein FtsX [Paracoccaceae bacterium]|nr:cell division protein FtsX [Paracoccaceae bacterium]